MNKRNKQEKRIALITGAARRIGAAIAIYLHQKDFRVVLHCHQSVEEAVVLANRLNKRRSNSATVCQAQLNDKQQNQQLIEKTLAWGGRLDVLVNNASLFKPDSTSEKDAGWDALFNTNVRAPFWLSYNAYSALAVTEGCIINITDIHAQRPLKGYTVYCQSKAALAMQTQALAREFSPSVRVNGVAPGAILWPEHENVLTKEKQDIIIAKTPLKRHGHPLYIAQAVFAMVENTFITGQIVAVDGGRVLL